MEKDVIYIDNNATTRPYPEVLETMKPFFRERFGNPSSVHQIGRDAKEALDSARERVAEHLGAASPMEIVFVSCATEANTMALRGMVSRTDESIPHLITSNIEHPSILETCEDLEKNENAEITYLSVDENGLVDPEQVRESIRDHTVGVSIMTANNEVGTVQPIERIASICDHEDVLFHTDAVQTPGKIELDVEEMNVDLLSLSAHKFHGPRGIGILYRKKKIEPNPLLRGGGQEHQLRSGTEPVALAAGMAKALQIATDRRGVVSEKTDSLRRQLWNGLQEKIGNNLRLNTPLDQSLPNTLNVSFPGREADKLMITLDLQGICVSAGSACHSGAIEVSHVLEAMNVPEEAAKGSVRFSFSHENTKSDVERTIDVIDSQL